MGFFKNLFAKGLFRRREEYGDDSYEEEDDEAGEVLKRSDVDMNNDVRRRRFVESCLTQMSDASEALDKLKSEYNLVTEYLTDMEEIEALPPEERRALNTDASKLEQLSGEKKEFTERPSQMTDAEFERVQRAEDEIEEGLSKIKKEEEYRELVKKDLARLEGEKHAYRFRKKELQGTIANARGMAAICICALIVCMALLMVLQFGMRMNTRIGYILTVGAAAVTVIVVFLRYTDAREELFRVENTMNRLILLQNRVKIRYVNSRNLLNYYYLKYGVNDGEELKRLWERYLTEKEERDKFKRAQADFTYYEKEFLRKLNRYPLRHPRLWLRQGYALLDDREMVEIRHALITRRQSLRKQIDYNKELAESASAEIKETVREYPQHAREILAMVDSYEGKA